MLSFSKEQFEAILNFSGRKDETEEILHKIGAHEFKYVFDKADIMDTIRHNRERFNEDEFLPYKGSPKKGYLTEKTYNENVDKLLLSLEEMTTPKKAIEFIELAQKKKNGTLYKKRIVHKEYSENATFFHEAYVAWERAALVVQAVDDFTLRLQFDYIKDLP